MSDRVAEFVELGDDSPVDDVLDALFAASGPDHVLVRRPHVTVGAQELAAMVLACGSPMAATASPVPSKSAPAGEVRRLALHDRLPPPASIPVPCLDSMVVSREALRSVARPIVDDRTPVDAMLLALSGQLIDAGWRHVSSPSVALDWNPVSPDTGQRTEGMSRDLIRELAGPANEGLATHRLWADYDLRSPRVVIDGACLTDTFHNGSQKVVINIARALKRSRPSATVALAVREEFLDFLTKGLADRDLDVIARRDVGRDFDVVYRPYQLIDPAELSWLVEAGDRLLLGQLDMIAFSNPSYHPSSALFHEVRNLQRRTLRLADGVTFISAFGEATTIAECPDLDRRRLFVVSCGTESELPTTESAAPPAHSADDYVLCLSATFWHKNRQHALQVFERLCARHGYTGSLLIAGPQPFYGRSTEAERRLLDAMPVEIAGRVVELGQVDEVSKWDLLRRARLVLYPSIVEGFGLVPFEAATVGTPSLSHAGSGLVDTLEGTPCLVPTWAVDEWAERAHELISSEQRSAELVEAVERAAAKHTWDRVSHDTWAAIDATVAAPSVRPRLEEGGWTSRVAPADQPLAAGARAMHFAHRCLAYLDRRLRRAG